MHGKFQTSALYAMTFCRCQVDVFRFQFNSYLLKFLYWIRLMTPFSARIGQVMVSLALLALILASLTINAPIRFPLDDAYITIANAELLLVGGIDPYGHDRPTGATSVVHLMLLALLGLFMELPVANFALAAIAAAAYGLGLCRLGLLLGAGAPAAVLIALTGLVSGAGWFQMMNGLETGLAMAAVTWVAVLLQDQQTPRRAYLLACLIGVLPFIRPELSVLAILISLSEVLYKRRQLGRIAGPATVALATVVLFSALTWQLTGALVPYTAGAKESFFAESLLPVKDKLRIAAAAVVTSPVFPLLAGLAFLPLIRGGWAFLAFAAIFLAAAARSLPGGLYHNDYRYLYVFVPLGLAGWAALCRTPGRPGAAVRVVFLILAIAMVALFPLRGWPNYRDGLEVTSHQDAVATWAAQNLPSGARVLIHDAGFFAWKTDFALIDMVGLKSPEVIGLHRQYTMPSLGADRGRVIDEIARAGGATHAIILNLPFWRDMGNALRDHGWHLDPLYAPPGAPYQVFRISLSGD